jgi:hypothetical protein
VQSEATEDSPATGLEIRAEPLGVIAAGLDELASPSTALLAELGELRPARVGEVVLVSLQAANLGSASGFTSAQSFSMSFRQALPPGWLWPDSRARAPRLKSATKLAAVSETMCKRARMASPEGLRSMGDRL